MTKPLRTFSKIKDSKGCSDFLFATRPQGRDLTASMNRAIANGHHRIEILRERGVDVNQLPRELRIP